jgi:hypothetical protein
VQRIIATLTAAWAGWKKIAHVIGTFNARVLLTVFYVLLVTPIALILRAVADPLRLARHSDTYWLPVEPRQGTDLDQARRQGA